MNPHDMSTTCVWYIPLFLLHCGAHYTLLCTILWITLCLFVHNSLLQHTCTCSHNTIIIHTDSNFANKMVRNKLHCLTQVRYIMWKECLINLMCTSREHTHHRVWYTWICNIYMRTVKKYTYFTKVVNIITLLLLYLYDLSIRYHVNNYTCF